MAGWWADPGKPAIWGMTDEPQPQADPVPPQQPAYPFPVGGSMAGKSWADVPRDGGKVNSRWFGGPRAGGRHAGIDIPGKVGDPVLAPAGGKVIRAGQGQGYGNMVDVMAPDGSVHRYAHLSAVGVRQGDELKPGQTIGAVGFSGNAGPEFPHLHYEVFPSAGAYGASAGMASRSAWARREDPSEYWSKASGAPATQEAPTAPANTPVFSAYSPQARGSRMEGGYASARPGPDGQAVVRTVDDWKAGRSPYVTAAGDPSQYGKSFTVPSMPYWNGQYDQNGQKIIENYKDVPFVVHDTGSAFKGKGDTRFDIPVARDVGNDRMNGQPWSMRPMAISDQPGAVVAQAPQPQRQQVAGIVVDEPRQQTPAPQQTAPQQPQTPIERAQVATAETPKFQAPMGLGGPKEMAFPDDILTTATAALPFSPVAARGGAPTPQNSVIAARGGGPVISQVPGQDGAQPGAAGGDWQSPIIGNIPMQTSMDRNRAMADQLAKLAYQKEGPRHWLEGVSRTGAAIGSEYFGSEADKKENASRAAEYSAIMAGRPDTPENRMLAYMLMKKGADAGAVIAAALAPKPIQTEKTEFGTRTEVGGKTAPLTAPSQGARPRMPVPPAYGPGAAAPAPTFSGMRPQVSEGAPMSFNDATKVSDTKETPTPTPDGKGEVLGSDQTAPGTVTTKPQSAIPMPDASGSTIAGTYADPRTGTVRTAVGNFHVTHSDKFGGETVPDYMITNDRPTMHALEAANGIGTDAGYAEELKAAGARSQEIAKAISDAGNGYESNKQTIALFHKMQELKASGLGEGTLKLQLNRVKAMLGMKSEATAPEVMEKLKFNIMKQLQAGFGGRSNMFLQKIEAASSPNAELQPGSNFILLHELEKANEFTGRALPALKQDYLARKADVRLPSRLDDGFYDHVTKYYTDNPMTTENDYRMMEAAHAGADVKTLMAMKEMAARGEPIPEGYGTPKYQAPAAPAAPQPGARPVQGVDISGMPPDVRQKYDQGEVVKGPKGMFYQNIGGVPHVVPAPKPAQAPVNQMDFSQISN